jgi:glyoxylase-like metal-dependent hydrolase (beta-lactamase superfamily II)
MKIHTYTGGMVETNAYFVESSDGTLLIDAPEGAAAFALENGFKVSALVLTHGHFDHMWDAAEVAETFRCPVYYHRDDAALCENPTLMLRIMSLPGKLRPVQATRFLAEGEVFVHGEWKFGVLHVPGHCPGSICLYEREASVVFGGDVLFAGGVGRWDLPGGSKGVLLDGIRKKLMPLPDAVTVYPGHGPGTTIGDERRSNPYVNGWDE